MEDEVPVQVMVRDNNVDQALRALKKKMQREGIFREMKLRRSYEKPSERRAREKAEAQRRFRKLMRKRLEREGYQSPLGFVGRLQPPIGFSSHAQQGDPADTGRRRCSVAGIDRK
eukprot:TRINITY_DN5044_c0_g2_i1.p5 TRINITY_DN5044_c0_g2~~TRINITY_DN5044_c0_g2_i1.p5  ORF type:complete len:115 (+),score=12.10 TRINITY_DN5044_c0_g2_i1:554-898(+)